MDTTGDSRAPARAPAAGARLPLLDVLRGLAIVGSLGTNIWLFAAPGGEISALTSELNVDLRGVLAAPSGGAVAEAVLRFASNGKFLSLLTLLFGAGLAIQFRSAARRGQHWPGRFKWRALFLFAEGAVHFTLVFAWDVLMGYAVVSVVAAWVLTRSQRLQAAVMWVHGGVHVALAALLTAVGFGDGAGSGGGVSPETVRLYAEGGYLEQVVVRLENAALLRIEPVVAFPLLLFLFLAGVRLLRAGAFAPGPAGEALRRRLLVWGLGAGLPLNVATALGGGAYFFLDRYVAAPVLALGLIGLVGRLLDRASAARAARGDDGRSGPVAAAFANLGRVAMTGYVLQNVLAMLLCYGFGLGLASRLAGTGPWWVIGMWAGISLVLLAGSALWLRRFDRGPLEAAQRGFLARIPERRAPERSTPVAEPPAHDRSPAGER